jgi:NAD(P)H dehydrogenase (quinone)
VDFANGWVDGMNGGEWVEETNDLEKLVGHKPKSAADYFRHDFLTQKQ